MGRSLGFGSMTCNLRPIQTRFRFGSGPLVLNLATYHNSLARSTKSTRLHIYSAPTACKQRVSGSISLPFRGSFHLSLTVLCAIGHQVVFSLGGWSPLLPTGFHVSRGTLDHSLESSRFAYGTFTLFGRTFQSSLATIPLLLCYVLNPHRLLYRFGLFPFRSPLLRESIFLSTPQGT